MASVILILTASDDSKMTSIERDLISAPKVFVPDPSKVKIPEYPVAVSVIEDKEYPVALDSE